MPISRVDYDGRTLIDLTNDTVTSSNLISGITAHDKSGKVITGSAQRAKPEREKSVTISENGTTTILPEFGEVLSKVIANVNVEFGKPFSKVIVESWIPASLATSYSITDGLREDAIIIMATKSNTSNGLYYVHSMMTSNKSLLAYKTFGNSLSQKIIKSGWTQGSRLRWDAIGAAQAGQTYGVIRLFR